MNQKNTFKHQQQASSEQTDKQPIKQNNLFAKKNSLKHQTITRAWQQMSKDKAPATPPIATTAIETHKQSLDLGLSNTALLQNQHSTAALDHKQLQEPKTLSLQLTMHEISKAAQKNIQSLEIQLHPKELGKIAIRLDLDHKQQVQIHIIMDNPNSRQALEQQLPQLRQIMQEQGLSLGDFQCSTNEQSTTDQQADQEQEHQQEVQQETEPPKLEHRLSPHGLSIHI